MPGTLRSRRRDCQRYRKLDVEDWLALGVRRGGLLPRARRSALSGRAVCARLVERARRCVLPRLARPRTQRWAVSLAG